MDYAKKALEQHLKLRGKLSIKNKDTLDSKEKLSIYYTPLAWLADAAAALAEMFAPGARPANSTLRVGRVFGAR